MYILDVSTDEQSSANPFESNMPLLNNDCIIFFFKLIKHFR